MTYRIQKAAVIGAGTMGSAIAALLAGVGVPTMLLDIPAPDSAVGDKPAKRNAFALKGIERLKNSRPSELYEPADLDLITPGNTEDHLHLLADADWVVEVVIEKLDVKRALFGKLAEVVKPNAILSSNTSGLPIRDIADGMGSEFSRRFMGTHFFNPPRYLPLLELIPHPDADPEAVAFMQQFLSARLGRGVVIANDEPNFIGNRFMSMLSSQTVNHAIDNALTVDEVDAITGPLIGRPKSATFRLSDVVGNDIAWHVGANLYPAIPNDPHREILQHPGTTAVYQWLLENKYLGNKTGQGFYKRVDVNGEKQFWSLNLTTLEYEAPIKVRLESVGKHRKVEALGERVRLLMAEEDKAGAFLFHHFAFYLTYASQRVPEITESLVSVDNAQKWGFAHEMGPFEIWDAIGVADSAARFAAAGYTIAAWVEQMLESGKTHFYQRDSSGKVIGVYSPITGDYTPLEADTKQIKVAHLRADQKLVKKNSGGAILDMGDGIALLEMTTDNSVIDGDFVQMGMQAVELLNNGDFRGLVIGHDSERFSIGANLFLVMVGVQSGQLDQIDAMVRGLQDFAKALRYANGPVVTAPFNMALGGGTEILMAGDATVAHAELYAGLVEFGVGVIPAGSGTKELMRRAINPVMRTKNADVLPHLRQIFEQIAFAKVSASAKEAREMHILRPTDRIVMNRQHLLAEAKRTALYMADGYVAPQPEKIYAAGRDVYAALLAAIDGLVRGKHATEHDGFIARKLAFIMTGGAISEPTWLDEQVILNLEREAFVELAQHPKTLERIGHMLQTNKPLRN